MRRNARNGSYCALVLFVSAFFISPVQAKKPFVNVYGGDVHFYGQVVHAACSVSADSRNQIVQMGQVRSNEFQNSGEWEDPVSFQIKLEDCSAMVSQSAGVIFTGQSDGKDPQVFRAGDGAGAAQGIGIGIFDAAGHLLVPDSQPLWFAPLQDGESVLSYIAKYRATSTVVKAGDAGAQVWFNVVYQ
ncbi:fimbrial protein [Lelliottia sp. CFBP8978]|jgi:fimbrial protein|uniref:fimbrial protein n=1 Tax=Lelliottia sp. CFBP8978 TaxID=3096522 RepID=UPI002A6ABDD9|nr:fimbrial protein [Lelliottia sp. CFBP8978]MDY1038707.1 fimbrial protein [Lelliottia sp. CFBP8978]